MVFPLAGGDVMLPSVMQLLSSMVVVVCWPRLRVARWVAAMLLASTGMAPLATPLAQDSVDPCRASAATAERLQGSVRSFQ